MATLKTQPVPSVVGDVRDHEAVADSLALAAFHCLVAGDEAGADILARAHEHWWETHLLPVLGLGA